MADIQIQLSDEQRQFVEDQVAAGNFASAEEYLIALIARAKQIEERDSATADDNAPALDANLWNTIRTDVDGHTGI